MAEILSSVLTPALKLSEAQLEGFYSVDKKTGDISRAVFGMDPIVFKNDLSILEKNLEQFKEKLSSFDASKILTDIAAPVQKEIEKTVKLLTADMQNLAGSEIIGLMNKDFNNFITKLQDTFKIAKDDIPSYIATLKSKLADSVKDITPESIINTKLRGALGTLGIGSELQKRYASEWSDAQKALFLSAGQSIEKFKEIAAKIGEDFSFGFKKAEEDPVEIPVKIEEPEKVTEEVKEVVEAIEQKAEETPIEVPVQPTVDKSDEEKLTAEVERLTKNLEVARGTYLEGVLAKQLKDAQTELENLKKDVDSFEIPGTAFTSSMIDEWARQGVIDEANEKMRAYQGSLLAILDMDYKRAEESKRASEEATNALDREAKMAEGLRDAYASAFGAQEAKNALRQEEEQKNAAKAADEYAKKQKASSAKAKKSIEEVIDSAKKLVQALNKVGKAAVDLGKSAVKLGFGTLKGMLHTFTLGLGSAKKEATLLSQALKLVGIAGVGALFKKANESATELTKNMNIVNEQFGSSATGLHKWAEQSAWAFNVSRTEAEKYFGELGDFLSNVGVEAEQSAVMVKNMVGYSGLIATRKGLKTEDVEKVFAKVIEGSTRGQAYKATLGIDLNDKAINSALKSMNIEATYNELNEADKATARWLATMYQLSDQFDLTADSLGNFEGKISTWDGAIETITSNAKDALTDLGLILQHYLLPIVQVLARIVSALANSLRNLVGALGLDIPEAPALEDTADGVGKLGDEYEKTGKKAKKAGLGLASFDKLNNLSSGSSADGLGGASSKLKDAIGLFDKIPDVSKQRKTLQEMLDSLMNKDWNLAGQNFGKWVNNIVNSAKSLIKRLKKYNLGKKLADWVNGVFKGIDWKNAGELFDGLWNLIFDNIEGFLRDLNAKDVGTAIQQFLRGFNIQDKLGDIGTNFGLAVQKLSEIINGIFEGDDGKKLFDDIKNGFKDLIGNAISEIKPEDLGEAVSNIAKVIGNALTGTADGMEGLGKKLAKTLQTIIEDGGISTLAQGIRDFIGAAITEGISLVNNLLGGEDGDKLRTDIKEKISELLQDAISGIKPKEFGEAISNIASTLGSALLGAAEGIDGLGDKLAETLNEAIEDGGIEDLAKGIGSFLGKALSEGVKFVKKTDWLALVKGIIGGIADGFTDNASFTDIANALAGLFVFNKLKGLATTLKKLGKDIMSTLSGKVGSIPLTITVGVILALMNMYEAESKVHKEWEKVQNWLNTEAANYKGKFDVNLAASINVRGMDEVAKVANEKITENLMSVKDWFLALEQSGEDAYYQLQDAELREKFKGTLSKLQEIKDGFAEMGVDPEKLKPIQDTIDKIQSIDLDDAFDEDTMRLNFQTIVTETERCYGQLSMVGQDAALTMQNYAGAGLDAIGKYDVAAVNRISKDIREELGMTETAVDESSTKMGESMNKAHKPLEEIVKKSGEGSENLDKMKSSTEELSPVLDKLTGGMYSFIKNSDLAKEAAEKQRKKEEELKKETEKLKTENGYLSNAIELLSKTDLPTFKKSVEELNTPLDHFLDSLSKIHTSDFGMGKITDTVALQRNMDEAFRIVDEASKKIDSAIAAASNLRNFEATLSSTQTIKVDSSGTMNFKFDVTTKPDKDAFNSWQEKYTKANKALNG